MFQLFILLTLLLITVQDLKERAVYWFLFPLLSAALIALLFEGRIQPAQFLDSFLVNTSFLVFQLLVLTLYFSIKKKQLVNITKGLLGWGDIFLLLAVSCYLSVLNFLVFYIMSLVCTLFVWVVWQYLSKNKWRYIPLAGLQSLCFMVMLMADWWCLHVRVTDDYWLMNYVWL